MGFDKLSLLVSPSRLFTSVAMTPSKDSGKITFPCSPSWPTIHLVEKLIENDHPGSERIGKEHNWNEKKLSLENGLITENFNEILLNINKIEKKNKVCCQIHRIPGFICQNSPLSNDTLFCCLPNDPNMDPIQPFLLQNQKYIMGFHLR